MPQLERKGRDVKENFTILGFNNVALLNNLTGFSMNRK
jgi:hypothetical protein